MSWMIRMWGSSHAVLDEDQVRRYAALRGHVDDAACRPRLPDRTVRRAVVRVAGATVVAFGLVAGAAGHGDEPHAAASSVAAPEQKAWGIAGDRRKISRTVRIEMTDAMRFTPAHLDVVQGETLRFVVENRGKALHEIVLGTRVELEAHAAQMRKFPGMEHDEPYMAHVAPGRSGELVWHFNRAGTFDFACLVAGHFEAGMTGTIRVAAADEATASGLTAGEVRKVDREMKKITLRHAAIAHLEMPPMTMVFQVRDPALLDRAKAGDQVRFRAEKIDGVFVVTTLEPAD